MLASFYISEPRWFMSYKNSDLASFSERNSNILKHHSFFLERKKNDINLVLAEGWMIQLSCSLRTNNIGRWVGAVKISYIRHFKGPALFPDYIIVFFFLCCRNLQMERLLSWWTETLPANIWYLHSNNFCVGDNRQVDWWILDILEKWLEYLWLPCHCHGK